MFYKISFFILLFETTKCSLVIDSLSQRGVYVTNYCPKMKYCAEGAHVMCMYYNPNQVMGPRCSNPKNVSVTRELAAKLLDVSNAVRSKIALGKEKGKGGEYLPRGLAFDMMLSDDVAEDGSTLSLEWGTGSQVQLPEHTDMYLKWDSELATFAQVLANQCVLRHDMCRATKRFPDPGQTAGLVRFSYPDWYPISKAGHFTTPGLNDPKLIYATTQTLKSWYGQKNSVTINMVTTYPDWTENPNNQGGRLYLEMIYGPATHMGCGISAYTEYAYYDNNAALNYNSVQIICNYSSRPRKNGFVYNTTAPATPDYSAKCGCPLGSVEDDDCLCHEEVKTHPTPLMQPIRKCSDGNCDATVVLLPIFTIEDAPPDKLISMTWKNDTPTRRQDSMEFIDLLDEPRKHELTNNFETNFIDNKRYKGTATARPVYSKSLPQISRKRILDVKNRHFDQTPHTAKSRHQRTPSLGTLINHGSKKKQSIFTRQAKFILHANNRNGNSPTKLNSVLRTSNINKKDVSPRKDFTKAQKLVNNYLEKNKFFDPFRTQNQFRTHKDKYNEDHVHDQFNKIQEQATETILHTAEDKVINFNPYLRNQNSTPVIHRQETDDSDKRLMNLLDNLEMEVKNIELHGSEKQIFDAKIRKIYGKVLGKPGNFIESKEMNLNQDFFYNGSNESKTDFRRINPKHKIYDKNYINDETKLQNNFQQIDNINGKSYERHSDFAYNSRPLSRNQNTIRGEERNNYYRDTKDNGPKTLSSYEDLISYGKYNNEIKIRNTFKNDFDQGFNKNNLNEIPKRGIKKQRNWDTHDDPLSAERRKYYQDKLDNLERRLQNTRSYKHRNELENDRRARRLRPTDDYHMRRSASKKQIDSFYMPERARFLHGFR